MTLTSQIITDAFRKSNLIAVGTVPTTTEQTEALRYLNRIVKSVIGNEAGEKLEAFPIGDVNIERPSGYPWWSTTPDDSDWFVPKNARVMLNLGQSVSLYLHPEPDDGSRFAASDVIGNLATYPVTVYGNGRTIESTANIVLNTNNIDSEWFYRADLGNWQKYAPLISTDTFPFPEEFDNYFISLLMLDINPSYGATMDDQSALMMRRSATQLRARYSQNIPEASELGITRLPRTTQDRWPFINDYTLYNPNSLFNRGRPW